MFVTGCYTEYHAPGAVGRVIDSSTGAPVRGARVTRLTVSSPPYLSTIPAVTVTSDKTGAFILPPDFRTVIRFMYLRNPKGLSGTFTVLADGYATNELRGTATSRTFWRVELGEIELQRP